MFSHILVPVAPPFLPRTALMTAAALSVEQCAELSLVYVSDERGGFLTPLLGLLPDENRARLNRFLGDALAIVSEYGAKASLKVVRGAPIPKAIKDVVQSLGADVIFVGMHRRSPERSASNGAITKALLTETSVPVLVIYESPVSLVLPVANGLAS
jgi:nucleotide-binding universal stress UspA family protein